MSDIGPPSPADRLSIWNRNYRRYPSPFFDLAQTWLPDNIKSLFEWCEKYFLLNPVINAVIYKRAEYPITDLKIDENAEEQEFWTKIAETLSLRVFLLEAGLDYGTYGNVYVSVFFPIQKFLRCPSCGKTSAIEQTTYKYRQYHFFIECSHCKETGIQAEVHEITVPELKRIRLIRWNPRYVSSEYNPVTGDMAYFLEIPPTLRNDILVGRKHIIETVPQVFLEALEKERAVTPEPDNFLHWKRPTISQKNPGLGLPLLLPVMKDAFYAQVLRRAQECVTPETLIETRRGLVQAKDVQIGDEVRTHLGRFRIVENRWDRDARAGEVGYEIFLTSLRDAPGVYSPHHPILTLARNNLRRRCYTKDRQRSSVILRHPHLWEEAICPAEKFKPGDYVLYPRSLPTSLSEIDLAKKSGLIATETHVYSKGGEKAAVSFERLCRGEKVRNDNPGKVAKRLVRDGRFPKRLLRQRLLSEDFGYILGWYAGDGSAKSYQVCFYLGKNDNPVPLVNAFQREFGIEPTIRYTDNTIIVTAHDSIVAKVIRGILPGRAPKKFVPDEILHASDRVKLAFLRGYFEADGSRDKRRITFMTASPELAYGTYRLCLHFGCLATITRQHRRESEIKGRIIREGTSYPVVLCNASAQRLQDLLDERPAKPVISGKSGFFWKDYVATRIYKVQTVAATTFIDLKVQDDATFCTAGTAVKNSIAHGKIVPLEAIFPAAGDATTSAFGTYDLGNWRNNVLDELAKWRQDPNYICVMPVPIGHQLIGGEGKALLITNEVKQVVETIIAGMQTPPEFVFGGLNFTGSDVSLRVFHQGLVEHQSALIRLVNFVFTRIAAFLRRKAPKISMKKLKLASDLQRNALIFNMNQAQKISDRTTLEEMDLDLEVEEKNKAYELTRQIENQKTLQLAMAEIQGEVAKVQARYAVTPPAPTGAQEVPGMPAGAAVYPENSATPPAEGVPPSIVSPLRVGQAQGGDDLYYLAGRAASFLDKQDEVTKQTHLLELRAKNPELFRVTQQILLSRQGSQTNPLDALQMPMPQEKPPRRAAR